MTILLIILLSILSFILLLWKRRHTNFPPGPPNYPIIGSLASLKVTEDHPIHEVLLELSGKYGPLIGLYLGSKPAVAVNGYDAVKHVLSRDDCSSRPNSLVIIARSFNKKLGLVFSDGSLWKEHRRFTLRHLRDFGFGKQSMESLIHDEIATLIENIDKRIESTPNIESVGTEIQDLFPISMINILWAIMAGKRYDHENLEFKKLIHFVEDFFRNGTAQGGLVTIWPFLRFVPLINSKFNKTMASCYALQNFMKISIDEHKESYDDNYMRDYIDIFLRQMKTQENDKKSTFTDEQLIVLCSDLFLAGAETTSGALSFIFLYMMLYPEVQEKMRQEIQKVVGENRLPSTEDGPKLHYIQAVIHEVLRHGCVAPFTPPHATDCDTNILQYQVPKETLLMINLHSVLMEKSYWGDPEVFRPERFIDKNGIFHKDDHLLIFGYGSRICLGEPLARNSTLLFLTTLLQRYSCSLPKDIPKPSMNHLQGLTSSPRPYTIVLNKQ